MNLGTLLDLLESGRIEGHTVRDYSIYCTEARRLSLGIKDRETGNPHAPLSLSESRGGRYLLVWDDGRVSRGSLERRQLEGDPTEVLAFARAAAYEDPDAACVAEPAAVPDVELHHPLAAAISLPKLCSSADMNSFVKPAESE